MKVVDMTRAKAHWEARQAALTKAFNAGWWAGKARQGCGKSNPYTRGTDEHASFIDGYWEHVDTRI